MEIVFLQFTITERMEGRRSVIILNYFSQIQASVFSTDLYFILCAISQ